jgi:hypothetical protein
MRRFCALVTVITSLALARAPVQAATATSLSSFEGEEEPTVIYRPSTGTFASDSFDNITDQGGGVIRTTLRYNPQLDWWDGDRATTNTDRQRAEVKGLGAHQKTNQTFRYTFDFRTDPNTVGTGSFFHIFQLKATDGDNSPPLVTVSLRENGVGRLQLWSGTASGSTAVRTFSWTPNAWKHVEVLITTATDNTGSLLGSFDGDAFTGATALPNFRPDATDYRPKWGFYRGINSNLYKGTNWIEHRAVTSNLIPTTTTIWNPTPTTDRNWNTTDANNWIKSGLPAAFSTGSNALFTAASVGTVTLAAGGVSAGAVTVENSTGTYTFSGGALTATGALMKTGAGALTLANAVTAASTTVSAGTLTVNGSLGGAVTVASGATLAGSGTLAGAVSIQTGGKFAPGASPAPVTVGSLNLASGATLELELGGAPGSALNDSIAAASSLALGGALKVSALGNFTPQPGQTFTILSGASRTGQFTGIELPTLAAPASWKVEYKPTSVSLVVLPSGDFNRDGVVDAADLDVWQGAVGTTNLGDADGDGDTDGADFLVWQRQLASPPAWPAGVAAPEPATTALAVLAAAGLNRRRRVRRLMG